jgi:hypothetical protein
MFMKVSSKLNYTLSYIFNDTSQCGFRLQTYILQNDFYFLELSKFLSMNLHPKTNFLVDLLILFLQFDRCRFSGLDQHFSMAIPLYPSKLSTFNAASV